MQVWNAAGTSMASRGQNQPPAWTLRLSEETLGILPMHHTPENLQAMVIQIILSLQYSTAMPVCRLFADHPAWAIWVFCSTLPCQNLFDGNASLRREWDNEPHCNKSQRIIPAAHDLTAKLMHAAGKLPKLFMLEVPVPR